MSFAEMELRDTLSRCVVFLHGYAELRADREYEARRWIYTLSEHDPQFRHLRRELTVASTALLDALEALEDWGCAISDGSNPSASTVTAVGSLIKRHKLI